MLSIGLHPNIVIFTTLLKGYCEVGDINEASDLFFHSILRIPFARYRLPLGNDKESIQTNSMDHDAFNVNVRSLNTYLRYLFRFNTYSCQSS